MPSPLRAALLIGAALPLFALAQSPPTCGATAQRLGSHSTPLGQQLVQVTVSPKCLRPNYAVIRYRSPQGGVLPPAGYLILRPGYPRHDRYWLSPGSRVEVKRGGVWLTIWRVGS